MIPLWRKTIKDSVAQLTAKDTSGHDIWHHQRVYGWARYIILHEPLKVDDEKVYPIALFHDVGWLRYKDPAVLKVDPKGNNHPDYSIEIAGPILRKIGFPESKIEDILRGIKLHDDTKPWGNNARDVADEIKVIQDADCIEAMGALGLPRLIIYGDRSGKFLYKPNGTYKDSTIQNIIWHIEKLERRLHTKTAKGMAKRLQAQQEQFIRNFRGLHDFAMSYVKD